MIKNTAQNYGAISILFHWSQALLIFILLPLGLWMVTLEYDSPWYHQAPDWHKSLGLLAVALMLLRALWHKFTPPPAQFENTPNWLQKPIHLLHLLLYILVFLLGISGYNIATAEGSDLVVFNWFSLPSLMDINEDQAEQIGELHEILAYALMALLAAHILGALKHHLIDKDFTLKRILPGGNHAKN